MRAVHASFGTGNARVIVILGPRRRFWFNTLRSDLGRDACVDALVEGTVGRRVDREFLLVRFKHLKLVLRQVFDLVNVLHLRVRAVAGDLAGGVRKHPAKAHVLVLRKQEPRRKRKGDAAVL